MTKKFEKDLIPVRKRKPLSIKILSDRLNILSSEEEIDILFDDFEANLGTNAAWWYDKKT